MLTRTLLLLLTFFFFFFSSRIIPIQISSLSQMNNSIQVGFFFFFFQKSTRDGRSRLRIRFLLPLTNTAWISQHAWHSFQPVFPGVLKRPLSFPPRISEHKDTQSCRVIQFVLRLSSPSAVCLVIQFRCAGSKNMFA